MQTSSQNVDDQYSDDDSIANLSITVTKNGDVSFLCNWADDDNGLSSMAHILSLISDETLSEKIIFDLKSKSSSVKEIDEIDKIILYFTAINEVRKKLPSISTDKVVILPIDAASML